MANGQKRTQIREHFDIATRLLLAEDDADQFEADLQKLASRVTSRLNWLIGLFAVSGLALIANLIILLVTFR